MDLFNAKIKDYDYPIRKLTLSPTESRNRPFIISVGQFFDADGKKDAMKVTRIEYRFDMYNKTGDKVYDIYVLKQDTGVDVESRWKRFENIKGIIVEYDQDF